MTTRNTPYMFWRAVKRHINPRNSPSCFVLKFRTEIRSSEKGQCYLCAYIPDKLFVRVMCNSPGFQCSDNAVKSLKRIENKQALFRELGAHDRHRRHPIWVKQGIDAWMTVAGIDKGRLLRSVSKSGKGNRDTLSDWAVWS